MENSGRDRWRVVVGVAVVGAFIAWFAFLAVRPNYDPRQIEAIEGHRDSRSLAVTVAHNKCDDGPRVKVDESQAGSIVVRAEQNVDGSCPDVGLETTLHTELEAPLGQRRIEIDNEDADGQVRCTVDDERSTRCSQR